MRGLEDVPAARSGREGEGPRAHSLSSNRRRPGQQAEALAARYLESKGYRVLARNYRLRRAEVDLIVASPTHLVFVEVKWRRHGRFGAAVEAVDARKQRRIALGALHFWTTHPQYQQLAVRFDVVAIDRSPGQAGYRITWIPDAFSARPFSL